MLHAVAIREVKIRIILAYMIAIFINLSTENVVWLVVMTVPSREIYLAEGKRLIEIDFENAVLDIISQKIIKTRKRRI